MTRMKKPHIAALDEVTITRDEDFGIRRLHQED